MTPTYLGRLIPYHSPHHWLFQPPLVLLPFLEQARLLSCLRAFALAILSASCILLPVDCVVAVGWLLLLLRVSAKGPPPPQSCSDHPPAQAEYARLHATPLVFYVLHSTYYSLKWLYLTYFKYLSLYTEIPRGWESTLSPSLDVL